MGQTQGVAELMNGDPVEIGKISLQRSIVTAPTQVRIEYDPGLIMIA
jgi:hypothetical protein